MSVLKTKQRASLNPDALLATKADFVLWRKSPAKSQRKVMRKDQLHYWKSLFNKIVCLKILVRENLLFGKKEHSARNRSRDSVRSTGKDPMMNQEWYCTSTAIAQTAIVYIASIYDVHETQTSYFFEEAVTLLFCSTICRRSFCSRGTLFDFNQAEGDFWRTDWLAPIRSTRSTTQKTRKRKHHFLFPAWQNMSWILKTNRRWSRVDHWYCTEKTDLCNDMFWGFMLNKTVTSNDVKFQRSRIVRNAKNVYDARIHAKRVAAVVVCCRASPPRSRSRQSNESAVDSSCTSLTVEKYTIGSTLWKIWRIAKSQKSNRWARFREEAPLRSSRGAPTSTTSNVKKAHARTRIRADRHGRIWQTGAGKEGIYAATPEEGHYYRDQCTVVQPNQRGGSNAQRTPWRQATCTVEKDFLTCHSQDPDAQLWSSWSPWTWSPSAWSSWWDSSSSYSWRQSPWSSSPDFAARVLSNTELATAKRAQGHLLWDQSARGAFFS